MAKNICVLVFIVIFISASQARANDETKRLLGGLAVEIIGMALEEHSKQSDQQEEIEWNDKKKQQNSSAIISEKTKDMQRDLKELGYYKGAVDGIFGSGTQQAILKFEEETCSQDDNYCRNGKLDQIDLDVIKTEAEQERINRKYREQNAQLAKANTEEEKIISDLIVTMEQSNDFYAVGADFISSETIYSYSVDPAFEKNYKNITKLYNKHLQRVVECRDISEEELEEIYIVATAKYKKSDEAKMFRMALAMGSMSLNYEQAMGRVKGSNIFSQANHIEYNKFKDKKFDQNTCDFSK
ncbi:MAG: hypothetical protein COA45_12540 [Zetaproteobacteria bacterium]|nr:MAG: hypothetical protein COA45_12540 [Zetaproteobacteria bacterium]